MAGRADFSRICFFFPQAICAFFVSCFYAGGKMLLFLDVLFFGFARVSFKKQQKKILAHWKVKGKKKQMTHETFLPQKKNFQLAQSTNKKQIRWRTLMFLLRGWTLLPLNDNWLGNSFDWFHWPNKESIQYLRNFLFSVEKSKKSSEIRLFLPPMISSPFSFNF